MRPPTVRACSNGVHKVCSQGSQVGDLKCCRLADGSTEHARACGSISLRYAEKLLLLLSMRLPRTEQLVAVRLLLRPRERRHEHTKWKGPGATMGRARHLIFPNRPETCSRQCVVKVSGSILSAWRSSLAPLIMPRPRPRSTVSRTMRNRPYPVLKCSSCSWPLGAATSSASVFAFL